MEDSSTRVLIIDDNPVIVELLQRKLEKEGFTVEGCAQSGKACERCREFRPHAMILDILMPGKSGWEVLEELKADPSTRDIPVIISTVKNRPEDIIRGMELGASDYIAKPYVFGDLVEKIKSILGET
jgi:DNA-binding response OmpR family regulator